jgi:TonB-linked SusC/RagA family outer membrane protein
MKLGLLMNLFFAVTITANTYSQQSFTLNLNDVTVKDVIKNIEATSNYRFFYNDELSDIARKIDVHFSDLAINDVLNRLFDKTGITYTILENNLIVIAPETSIQQKTITGTVVDEASGEPLIGVNVVVEGTTMGVITDANGKFSIEVNSPDAVLVVSYIGYVTSKVPVAGQSIVNVRLSTDVKNLEEVVVIGYGSVRKSDLTGSVSSIKSDDMRKIAMVSFDQGIQGRAAGVFVTNASSAPGGTVTVRVRGGNSLSSGNEPLYVVDGYPLTAGASAGGNGAGQNPLASINPGDIESIEILKDASSTAIYGARGANGVVLITTKRGKSGKTHVDYDVYFGSQTVAKKLDMLNATEWATLANEARVNDKLAPLYPGGGTPSYLFPAIEDLGEGTDWQDEIFRTAITSNHQLTVSGGTDITTFSLSGNLFDQNGVVRNSDFQRASFRANVDTKINDKLKLATSFTASRVWSNIGKSEGDGGTYAGASIINNALVMPPTVPVKDPVTNDYVLSNFIPNGTLVANPVAEMRNATDRGDIDRILGTVDLTYQIFKDLSLKVSLGTDVSNAYRKTYQPKNTYAGFAANGIASQANKKNSSYLNENILTYIKTLNAHSFNVVAGYTWQTSTTSSNNIVSSNYPTDAYGADNLDGGATFNQPVSAKSKNQLVSYLGRINYIFNDRYYLTLSGRADGSSKFGKNNKWAFFPSAAIAWRVSQESFMQNIDFLSNLKIRGSYGLTGNQEIQEYQSIDRYSLQNYFFGGSLTSGLNAGNIPNPDLKWETTAVTDIGLDLGFFDNRLTLTGDYYYKKTTDLLWNITVPLTTGFSTKFSNIGSVENKGLEISLSADIFTSRFKWNTSVNWSTNKNKVLEIPGYVPTYQTRVSGHLGINGSWLEPGKPVGVWNLLRYDGVIHNDAELTKAPKIGNALYDNVGDPKFYDKSGDGKIVLADDRVIVGDPNPDFIYGWSNNFSYKNFDLSFYVQGSYGNEILNALRAETNVSSLWASQRADMKDRWTQMNNTSDIPRARVNISSEFRNSSWLIEDGSYVRLKNVTLGYNIPVNKYFRNLRIYVSGQNLLTITDYSGFDPEVNSQGTSNLNLGVDYNSYPMARTFIVGLNIGFK